MAVVNNLLFGDTVYCSLSRVENGIYYFYSDVRETDIAETYYHWKSYLFMQPPGGFSSDVMYRQVISAKLCVYVSDRTADAGISDVPQFRPIAEKWSTYELSVGQTPPNWSFEFIPARSMMENNFPSWMCTDDIGIEIAQHVFTYGAVLTPNNCTVWTTRSSAVPYLSLEQGNLVGLTITPLYPASAATISKSLPTTFQWSAVPESENTLSPVSIRSCLLHWRYLGDTNYIEIPLTAINEYTFPAGTFETGTIEWQVSVTANSGVVTSTPWTTVQVAEPASTARTLFPNNTVIDGASPITFSWEHIISSGTSPSGFDLQTSHDQVEWTLLLAEKTALTTAEIPGKTFTSGDLYWRVRTYNLDGIAGEWSDAAHCIVIAAPDVPSVTANENAPRFSIRWHQFDQQGYEIKLDDTVICKKYGSQAGYTYDRYLDPGTYSIKVRIQNQYGLWSDWGEMILTMAESEEPPIALSVAANNHVAHLSWETDGDYDAYLIYRNGTAIATIKGYKYIDQLAAGHATYQVRGIYNDSGRCGTSPKCELFVQVNKMVISDVSNLNWIELDKSVSSLRSIQQSKSCSSTYNHFIGSALPSVDVGEAEYHSFELDCAWKNTDLGYAHAFEALVGKVVFIKTTTGRSVTALMDSFQKAENRFWTSYQAYLTPVDWEEGVE